MRRGQLLLSGNAILWSSTRSSPLRNRTLTLLTHSVPASLHFEQAVASVSPIKTCEVGSGIGPVILTSEMANFKATSALSKYCADGPNTPLHLSLQSIDQHLHSKTTVEIDLPTGHQSRSLLHPRRHWITSPGSPVITERDASAVI